MSAIKGYKFGKYFLNIEENKLYDKTDNFLIKLPENGFKILVELVKKYPNTVSLSDLLSLLGHSDINLKAPTDPEKAEINKVHQSIHKLRDKLKHRTILTDGDGYTINYPVEIVSEDTLENLNPALVPDIQTPTETPVAPEKSLKVSWKTIFPYVSFALILALLTILGLSFFKTKKDTSLTKITAVKVTNHLVMDENDGWRDLTGVSEKEKNENPSRATTTVTYEMRKFDEVATFPRRIGTSSLIMPQWKSDDNHPVVDTEDVSDDSKKCSDKIRKAKMVYTDISKEPLDRSFDYSFKTTYFNGHNSPKGEWQAFFVEIPIDFLDFKITFPKNKQFPKNFRLFKARDACYNEYEEQRKLDKLACLNELDAGIKSMCGKESADENLFIACQNYLKNRMCEKEYFEEDKNTYTIVWHIENPAAKTTYKIQWDWE